MKIITWNVNGLRAVHQKGFSKWLAKSQADLVCLQEIKAQPDQLPFDLQMLSDYRSFFHSAGKKGYSGVAVYVKNKPLSLKRKIGLKLFDQEGRFIQLNFPKFTIINLYLPHGRRDKTKLPDKLKAYDRLLNYFTKNKGRSLILAGDFNIAHREIDLARPKDNQNNIMFTPKEREKLNQLVNLGFTDTFRKLHPQNKAFTWWPYTNNARERDLGWRLDYLFISQKLIPKLKRAFILKEVNLSDHCPAGIDINLSFR